MSLVNKLLTDLERDSHPRHQNAQNTTQGMRPTAQKERDPYVMYHTKTLVIFLLSFGLFFGALFALYTSFNAPAPKPVAAAVAAGGPQPLIREAPVPAPLPEKKEVTPTVPNSDKKLVATTVKSAEKNDDADEEDNTARATRRVAVKTHRVTPQEEAEALYIKARGLRAQGRHVEAEGNYTAALSRVPEHLAARTELAQMQAETQHWDDALHTLSEGLSHHPQNQDLLFWRARILYDQGQKELAMDSLSTLDTEQVRNPELLALMAVLNFENKDYLSSVSHYRQALTQRPAEGRWWLGLGAALESLKEFPAAKEAYARALSDNSLASHLSQYAQQRLNVLREAAL